MPRAKKRKANKEMWNSKKKNRNSTNSSNESTPEKLFAEIADPDDDTVVNMDGTLSLCIYHRDFLVSH